MRGIAKFAYGEWGKHECGGARLAFELLLSHQIDFFCTEQHPEIVRTRFHLAALEAYQGDFEGVNESCKKEALALGIKVFGSKANAILAFAEVVIQCKNELAMEELRESHKHRMKEFALLTKLHFNNFFVMSTARTLDYENQMSSNAALLDIP